MDNRPLILLLSIILVGLFLSTIYSPIAKAACNQRALESAQWKLTEYEYGPKHAKTYTCADLNQDDEFTDAYNQAIDDQNEEKQGE